nr:O-antigen ligase family protein [Chitinophagales bacterium]
YHANLEDHIIATFQGKDISFAERVYRWVAAGHMIGERPLTGFGPGNFYNSYRPYTVERFKTYVSDNLEKSGVHCYYLMLAADQGLPGLLLFALMIYYTFIRGQNLYHRLDDPKQKAFVLVFLQIVAIVLINLLVSDLIEVDKIGTIFYTAISIIAGFDARYAIAPKQQPNIN